MNIKLHSEKYYIFQNRYLFLTDFRLVIYFETGIRIIFLSTYMVFLHSATARREIFTV